MKRFSRYLAGLAVCAMSVPALAGSYQLNDYSVTGLGRAYAGQGVVGDDYSAIAFNPAGMMAVNRSGVQAGMTFVNLKSDIHSLNQKPLSEVAPGKKHKMDFWAPVPNVFAQYNLNDKWAVGLGVYAPYGLKTLYDSDWFGSNTAILSKLDIIDINASVAYKFAEKWSVGFSAIARYIYGHMTNTLSSKVGGGYSDFELDGWTRTGSVGLMYEPTKDTRIGLSYRLRSTQQVKGDHKIKGNGYGFNEVATGRASPALPETLTLSGYHRYKEVGFSGTARWTHWSQSFPSFTMKSDSRLFGALSNPMSPLYPAGQASGVSGNAKTSRYAYTNSWTLTAGLDWYFNKNWTFRCGTGYDESPAHKSKARTIRIPDNDRFWLSVGASYIRDNWQIDAAYGHMFGRAGKVLESSDQTAAAVKYKNLRSNILGLQVQYKF